MKSLKLGNITKTLGLISAGALLGIFLLAPLSVGADHDCDFGDVVPERPVVFLLESTFGQEFTFTLVENGDGAMEFTHVPPPTREFAPVDDGD